MAPPYSKTAITVEGKEYTLTGPGTIYPSPREFKEDNNGVITFGEFTCRGQNVSGDMSQVNVHRLDLHGEGKVESTGIIPVRILHLPESLRAPTKTFTLTDGYTEHDRTFRVVIRHLGDEVVMYCEQQAKVTFKYDGTYSLEIDAEKFKAWIKFAPIVEFTPGGSYRIEHFGWETIQWNSLGCCGRKRLERAAEFTEEVQLPPHVQTTERKRTLPPPILIPENDDDNNQNNPITPPPAPAPMSPPNIKQRRQETLRLRQQEQLRKLRQRQQEQKHPVLTPLGNGDTRADALARLLKINDLIFSPETSCLLPVPRCLVPCTDADRTLVKLAVQLAVHNMVRWHQEPPYNLSCEQMLACIVCPTDRQKAKAMILDTLILLFRA